MRIIDARGLGCPKPVIMAEEELSRVDEGIVEVLVDNEGSMRNLTRFASKSAFYSESSKDADFWRVKIVKGYPCGTTEDGIQKSEVRSQSTEDRGLKGTVPDLRTQQRGVVESGLSPEQIKDTLLIIGTDTMGKEEELGRILMKAFFETMKVTRELPHTIFFLNAGVKLTSVNEEIVGLLKELAVSGVEIFSCGTCLKYYNLESEIKVGYRGTTNHIVEGMKDFKKTVWIG